MFKTMIFELFTQEFCNIVFTKHISWQHVLEHGKPDERSVIISKLTGRIVQMSQQKFASNVIEKCLIFGDLQERKLLVNEMLGSTDENQPLQVNSLFLACIFAELS